MLSAHGIKLVTKVPPLPLSEVSIVAPICIKLFIVDGFITTGLLPEAS